MKKYICNDRTNKAKKTNFLNLVKNSEAMKIISEQQKPYSSENNKFELNCYEKEESDLFSSPDRIYEYIIFTGGKDNKYWSKVTISQFEYRNKKILYITFDDKEDECSRIFKETYYKTSFGGVVHIVDGYGEGLGEEYLISATLDMKKNIDGNEKTKDYVPILNIINSRVFKKYLKCKIDFKELEECLYSKILKLNEKGANICIKADKNGVQENQERE